MYFISILFHELGHSTACRYFNAKIGNIGFGFYLWYPVFFADVSDAWKLPRAQRAIIDVAGFYFQIVFIFILYLGYLVFLELFLISTIYIILFTIIVNLNPFFRYDGYWLFSDLTGITNLRKRSTEVIKYYLYKIFRKTNITAPILFQASKKIIVISMIYVFLSNMFFLIFIYKAMSFLTVFTIEIINNNNYYINDIIVNFQNKNLWYILSNYFFRGLILCIMLLVFYKFIKKLFYFIKNLKRADENE